MDLAPQFPDTASPAMRVLPPRPVTRGKPARHRRYRRLTATLTFVALLGFLAGVAWFVLGRENPRERTYAVLSDLAHHVEDYRTRNGALPADITALVSLEGCYSGGVCPRDVYGSVIRYRVTDREEGRFELRSPGPDRLLETADDVVWPRS